MKKIKLMYKISSRDHRAQFLAKAPLGQYCPNHQVDSSHGHKGSPTPVSTLNIVRESTHQERNRLYAYKKQLDILDEGLGNY